MLHQLVLNDSLRDAQWLCHNLSISNYLKTKPGNYNGDVDIYFNSQEGLNKAIAYAYENSHTSSLKDDIMHEPFSKKSPQKAPNPLTNSAEFESRMIN